MPDAAIDIKARRFRRVALTGTGLTLAFFLWTIWMMVHFNNGSASVRFGGKTMLNIASITLPGPVLLVFLAWNARLSFCRVVGWISLPLALLLNGMAATYATIELRPPLAPGDYDAAVKEFENSLLDLAHKSESPVLEIKRSHDALMLHPGTLEEYVSLLARVKSAREGLEAASLEEQKYNELMNAPFNKRSVSVLRRDEYIRLISPRLRMDLYAETDARLAAAASLMERRVQLLVDQWGKWQWAADGAVVFDDPSFTKIYADLLKQSPASPAK